MEYFKRIRDNADQTKFKLARWSTDEEMDILAHIISLYKIRNYIECGTANGWSAAHASMAMGGEGQIYTFDIVERHLIPSHHLIGEHFHRHVESFETGVAAVLSHIRGRKLIFIDGDHTGGAPTRDFEAVEPFLRVGDLVIFHDATSEAPVRRAVERVAAKYRKWKHVVYQTHNGLGVFEVV